MLIQQYKESWPADFIAISKILKEVLLDLNITFEHIGSTSIPGLAAKPIIDIDIVYNLPDEFEKIRSELEKIGYYHNGNQGIVDREVFKRNNTANKYPILDSIAHHLYFCPANSKELQRHILFRDHLLKNETARIQYQAMKYEIAESAEQDRKKYAQLKEIKTSSFINRIILVQEKDERR